MFFGKKDVRLLKLKQIFVRPYKFVYLILACKANLKKNMQMIGISLIQRCVGTL
jgi:hypothetical protein